MRKGKDPEPDPDPYLWLMDPDPGGPKTWGSCGSGSIFKTNQSLEVELIQSGGVRPDGLQLHIRLQAVVEVSGLTARAVHG